MGSVSNPDGSSGGKGEVDEDGNITLPDGTIVDRDGNVTRPGKSEKDGKVIIIDSEDGDDCEEFNEDGSCKDPE